MSCFRGTIISDPTQLHLTLLSFTVATCSNKMDSIENGDVVYSQDRTRQGQYPEHTTATITCNDGYIVSGDNITTCQNDGTWSSIPSCESEPLVAVHI